MIFKANFVAIESSQIKGADYDGERQTMYIQFKNNAEYKYFNVSQEEYNDFLESRSKGKYFSEVIKCKNFRRVEV